MYQKITLNNGLSLLSEKLPEAKSVAIGFWLKIGPRDEKVDETGLFHFCEHLLFKGTKNRSASDIAKEIDSIGGVINAFTTNEYVCFYVHVPFTEYLKGLEVLIDIYTNAVFLEQEIEKEKTVIINEINSVFETPDDRVYELFMEKTFHKHSLGRPIMGYKDGIRKITKLKIQEFYQKHFHTQNTVISLAGNCDLKHVIKMIENTQFPQGKVYKTKEGNITPLYYTIESFPCQQMHFCLGTSEYNLTKNDYFVEIITNLIFGDSLSSRLHQKIREEYGYCYSIFSFLTHFRRENLFGLYANTSPDLFYKTYASVMQEIKLFADKGITENELKIGKKQLLGSLLLNWENVEYHMQRIFKYEMMLGEYFSYEQIEEKVNACTISHVTDLITKIFVRDKFVLTVLGPENIVEKDLLKELHNVSG